MEQLRSRRVPLAWLLMFIIALTGVGILAMLLVRASPPSNSVLIESLDDRGDISSTPLAAGSGRDLNSAESESPSKSVTAMRVTASSTPSAITVYISGAVKSPGVYVLQGTARVNDAILAAGGVNPDADLEQVNLAAYVSDQEHISVPKMGESSGPAAAPTKLPAATPKVSPGVAGPAPGSKLDLNSATAREFEELPGIGPVLAARIVADRDARGPFRSVDDLKRVPGIKDALLSRFKEFLTIRP